MNEHLHRLTPGSRTPTLRVIPVLDLSSGRPVHARGGRRESYGPVEGVFYRGDDPLGLALAYRDVLGLDDLYCADLDAIGGGPPDLGFLRRAAGAGLRVWVDVGLRDASSLADLRAAGPQSLIAATETLKGRSQLQDIRDYAGTDFVVFGLDLKGAKAIVAPGSSWGTEEPSRLIDAALAMGLRRVLILNTARIGTGRGVGTRTLARDLIRRAPDTEVTVGGGVASRDELLMLADLGVSAVLVGSALHDGRIGRPELRDVCGTGPGGLVDR